MAITTTKDMKRQLMQNPLNTTPEMGMEGGVTRPQMVSDLVSAMRDLDFRQLMEQYAAISGQSVGVDKPLTQNMMAKDMPILGQQYVAPTQPINTQNGGNKTGVTPQGTGVTPQGVAVNPLTNDKKLYNI